MILEKVITFQTMTEETINSKEKKGKPRFEKIKVFFENNIIRKISQRCQEIFTEGFRKSYYFFHCLLIFFVCYVFLFGTDLLHLVIILLLVSIDSFSIVVMHNCPLTQMEKKYLKDSTNDERKRMLKHLGISYKCEHVYENQIETMVNIWLLVSSKILIILFLKMTHFKIVDGSNIYTLK